MPTNLQETLNEQCPKKHTVITPTPHQTTYVDEFDHITTDEKRMKNLKAQQQI